MNKAEFYDVQNARIESANQDFLNAAQQDDVLALPQSIQDRIFASIADEQDDAVRAMNAQYAIDSEEEIRNPGSTDYLQKPWTVPFRNISDTSGDYSVPRFLGWGGIERITDDTDHEPEVGVPEIDARTSLPLDELRQRVHDRVAETNNNTLGACIAYALAEQPGRSLTEAELAQAIYTEWDSGTGEFTNAIHRVLNRYMYDMATGIDTGLHDMETARAWSEGETKVQFGKRWHIDESGERIGSWARVCRAIVPGASKYDDQPAGFEEIWDAVGVAETIERKPGESILVTGARKTGQTMAMAGELGLGISQTFPDWQKAMRAKGKF